ncbi:MAG: hypothetical protein GY714_04285 [Desulfobacterales bacterium]|nr:hypothetical protein [Desulfobacterales bacterium]
MNKKTIMASFCDCHENAGKAFIYITNNESQLELALLSVCESKFEFLIFIEKDLYDIRMNFIIPDNVKVTNDVGSVVMLMPKFNGIITTVGHLSPVLSIAIKKLFKAGAQLNLPLIEVPHGLYQWGYNLEDNSQFVNVASFEYGAGGSVPTIAENQINWFCEEGPGYPRYQPSSLRKKVETIVPEYTVITTNTNWYMYGHFEQRILFNIIFSYALKNPNKIFIWCPHPAEVQKDTLLSNMIEVKPQNIFLYGLTKEIYFNGIDTTEDVIKYAENGISTVSSCLLDYEIHETPVMLFESDGLSKIIESMNISSCFRSTEEFTKKCAGLIKTNKLYPYRIKVFDDMLDNYSDVNKLEIRNLINSLEL